MRAVYSKPAVVLQGWREALRGWRDNPLYEYWDNQERASYSRSPWYQRNPGLLFGGVLLSAVLSWLLWQMLAEVYKFPAGSYARAGFAGDLLNLAGLLTIAALFVLGSFWLLATYYYCARLALGFLEPQPRTTLRRNLDDLLAVSKLSEQDLLLGLMLHCLRRIQLPLIALTLSTAAGAWLLAYTQVVSLPELERTPSLDALLLLAMTLCVYVLGCLGTLCSLLALVSFGLSAKASMLPLSAAAGQCFSQFLLIAGLGLPSLLFAAAGESSNDTEMDVGGMYGLLFAAWGLTVLLAYMARRLNWLRVGLSHSLLFPLLFIAVAVGLPAIFAGENDVVVPLLLIAVVVCNLVFCPFCPLPFAFWMTQEPLPALGLVLTLLVLQLVTIPIFAGLARDAIQRRKWEGR
jgi:hypothetical protein